MNDSTFAEVPAGLGPVLAAKGFTELTPVQLAVLDPANEGRDLRILSRTGSGKTVALGLVVAEAVAAAAGNKKSVGPAVLLIAPTRELASQLGDELSWLFRPIGVRVGVVTGGTPIWGDLKMLDGRPTVLVGTPGRLNDHLRRGSLSLDSIDTVALDEADEMLDMGFVEELSSILDATPESRHTHLVSATFPREVQRLADRYQRSTVVVQGDAFGEAHEDIEHLAMIVRQNQRLDALTNLLLHDPDDKKLIFVRTRAEASDLSEALSSRGFDVRALSGEMQQRERTATLRSFRSGTASTLVATNVAARGLDVHDIDTVIHVDLPSNPEILTHRSGRTGRAGRQGRSILFVSPAARGRASHLARRAGIDLDFVNIPKPEAILEAADARFLEAFSEAEASKDSRLEALAGQLLERYEPLDVIAKLLARSDHAGPCSPASVAPPPRESYQRREQFDDRRPRGRRPHQGNGDFVRFQVSWGSQHGADPRRLLAVVCRRGKLSSREVGAIKVGDRSSMVEIIAPKAREFDRAASAPDPRDPRVKFRPWKEDQSRVR